MSDIENPGVEDEIHRVAFGWTQLAFVTCPFCEGSGERVVESGGRVTYVCEPCRGTGLLHPIRAKAIKERLAKTK